MRSRNVSRFAAATGAALALSLLLASAALASGPSTRTRGTETAICEGTPYTVVRGNGGQNIGAAQVLDGFGHAILVSGTSTYTDYPEAGGSVVLGVYYSFHGAGHTMQTQTLCVVTQDGHLSDLMTAGDLAYLQSVDPTTYANVSLSDPVELVIDFWVVLKV